MKKQWTTASDFILNGVVSSQYTIIEVEGVNQVEDGGSLSLIRTGNTGTPSQPFTSTGNNTCTDANGDEWVVKDGTILNYDGINNWFNNGFGSDGVGTYIALASGVWDVFYPKSTSQNYVQVQDTKAQEELLPLGSKIYPETGDLENGNNVTTGTTHLRVDISGKPTIISMNPISSGVVSGLTETGATIGGVNVTFSKNEIELKTASELQGSTVSYLIGQKIRTYVNLGGIDSEQVWEIVSSLPTGVEFGITLASGQFAKLHLKNSMTLADIGGVPESINPTFDNLPAWDRIQDLDVEIYFDDYYAVDGTARIKYVIGKKIDGKGINKCGFIGLDPLVEVFNTYVGSGTLTTKEASYTNFGVKGVGKAACVWAHVTSTYINQVGLQGFVGVDGHVFEYGWANTVGSIFSNGATLSGKPIKFNAGWLDTTFAHIYTSNSSDHLFYHDSTVIEYSNPGAGGDGINVITLLTLQGANVSAIKFPSGGRMKILQVYTENNESIFDIGSDGNSVSDLHMSGDFQGIRSATSTQIGVIDGGASGNINGVTFDKFSMYNLPIVVGRVTVGINFNMPRVRNNVDFSSLIRRNANTLTTMPISAQYQTTQATKMMLKTNGYQHRFAIMEVDNAGTWVPTILDVPLI